MYHVERLPAFVWVPCDTDSNVTQCSNQTTPGAMVYGSVVLNLPRSEAHALNAG